jgi:hypothetical protein
VIRLGSPTVLAALVLVLCVIGTIVAIALRVPAQLGGPYDPANVGSDFLSVGTGMSPPLVAMVIFAILIVLSAARGILRMIGTAGLAIVGLVFAVGIGAELASLPRFEESVRPIAFVINGAALVLDVLMVAAAARQLWRRGRA